MENLKNKTEKKELVVRPDEGLSGTTPTKDPRGGSLIRTFKYPGKLIRKRKLTMKLVEAALLEAAVESLRADGCDVKGFMRKFSLKPDGTLILQVVAELSSRSTLWGTKPTMEAADIDRLLKQALPQA